MRANAPLAVRRSVLVAVLWVYGAATGAAQVVAWTPATPPVARALAEQLPAGVELRSVPPAALFESVARGEAPACDLLLAVDLHLLAMAARRGLLRPGVVPPARVISGWWRDPQDLFAVPWAERWVLAWDSRRMRADAAPNSFAALGEVWLHQRLALCTPQAAPSPFVEFTRIGGVMVGENLAFQAWLDVDRSTRRWLDAPVAVLDELLGDPACWAALLPRSVTVDLDGTPFATTDLVPRQVPQGLGIAAVLGRAVSEAEIRALLAAVLQPGAVADVAAAARLERRGASPPPGLRLLPVPSPEQAFLVEWVGRFDRDVRGRSEAADERRFWIEIVLFGVVATVIVLAARHSRAVSPGD